MSGLIAFPAAMSASPPSWSPLSRFATPVVATLGAINRGVLRLLGIRDDARSAIS